MNSELTLLEQQLARLLSRFAALQAENQGLRSRVHQLENENRELSGKISLVSARIEKLLHNLPED